MPPAKRQKLSPVEDSDASEPEETRDSIPSDVEDSASQASGSEQSSGDEPDTDDEIEAAKFTKSKKTLKRKRRATDATHFGAALQSLLNTNAPSTLPTAADTRAQNAFGKLLVIVLPLQFGLSLSSRSAGGICDVPCAIRAAWGRKSV